jgi:hypothetical protein
LRTPDHEDSWIDICGYAALGGEKKMRDNSTMHFLERLELDQMENDWTAPDEFPDLTNCKIHLP